MTRMRGWTENAIPDLVEFAGIADLLRPGQVETFYVEEAAVTFYVVCEPGFADLRVGDVFAADRMVGASVSAERRFRYR
ncbi:hypothetical protein [Amycolatopsis sp. H20-H5]|uniref:hypothetical protein n=1 Tax=Amycolatopsis sp. H20-H5 TaxID=3046309 RepID=UPI002DBC7987|nr:hypothetical protein [Amycolatopsis sp. H20-H5]MEC3977790.1 hypothetical protein [Amycolatopsis sp. H20-H5]